MLEKYYITFIVIKKTKIFEKKLFYGHYDTKRSKVHSWRKSSKQILAIIGMQARANLL